MVARELKERWQRFINDQRRFISILKIENERNKLVQLHPLWDEQLIWMEALISKRFVLGLKPRQIGFTTVTCAYFFWKMFTSSRASLVLQMAHENDAVKRMARMVKVMYAGLPRSLQRRLTHSSTSTRFEHNQAGFQRLVAGGRGQLRSWTITDYHATEMAKWPRGSAANSGTDGEAADEEAWASASSAMHDERGQIVVESTGNGARGLFHRLWKEATRKESEWAYVFVPWNTVARYQRPVHDYKAFEATLDAEEQRLIRAYGLTYEQLAWRREKMKTLGISPMRFRREFPISDQDPFRLSALGWFNPDVLDEQLGRCLNLQASEDDEFIQYLPYESHRRYFIGGDTSGGVGADEACLHVLRDDLAHAAVWASRWASPVRQARMAARISAAYGRALTLIEANKGGLDVIEKAEELGCNTWRGDDGEHFWSTGGRAGDTKRSAFNHAREEIDAEWVTIQESLTIRQLINIVEHPSGRIAAKNEKTRNSSDDGDEHDDRAIAFVLALFCGRGKWTRDRIAVDSERARIARILALSGRARVRTP